MSNCFGELMHRLLMRTRSSSASYCLCSSFDALLMNSETPHTFFVFSRFIALADEAPNRVKTNRKGLRCIQLPSLLIRIPSKSFTCDGSGQPCEATMFSHATHSAFVRLQVRGKLRPMIESFWIRKNTRLNARNPQI